MEKLGAQAQPHANARYTFGAFAYDAGAGTLTCRGIPLALTPKTLGVLQYFLEHSGRIVTKAELLDALWPNEDVVEANLAQHVFRLRQALSRYAPATTFIVTAAKHGYRFIAPVANGPGVVPARDVRWRNYIKGRFYADQRDGVSLERAIRWYRKAIVDDAQFAAAHAGIAEAYVLLAEYLFADPAVAFTEARAAATRALEIDPANVQALVALGDVYAFRDWNFAQAVETLEKATWIEPAAAAPRLYKAWILGITGEHDAARSEVETVLRREPYALHALTTFAAIAILRGDFAVAIETAEDVLELDPAFELAQYYLGAALAYGGEWERCLALLSQEKPTRFAQQSIAVAGYAAGKLGLEESAERILGDLRDGSRWPYVSAFNLALVEMGMNRPDAATACLARGIADCDPWSVFLLNHPVLAQLPSIQTLRRRIQHNKKLNSANE
ncbi:MAG TPA: winged helix-turn-helix domain-containing protein [Candidatus Baltobacteraceae bacterium]|nr:winged helix-turn-helix domain-containing protein [Candidatus Baltobacteraceae bacterium]